MSILHALVLSLLQGLTEFLPISSSGHLILVPRLFNWSDQGLAFDIMVHLGTVMAVLIYFRTEFKNLVLSLIKPGFTFYKKLFFVLCVALIPAGIFGIIFKNFVSGSGRNVVLVSANLIFWGAILILSEYYYKKNQKFKIDFNNIGFKKGLFIGLSQAMAVFPGTSRSGITISAGLFADFTREAAMKFSFLVGVPVILGAGLVNVFDLVKTGEDVAIVPIIVGLLGAFFSGLAAIHFMMKFVKKNGLFYFGIYRILLGIFLILLFAIL